MGPIEAAVVVIRQRGRRAGPTESDRHEHVRAGADRRPVKPPRRNADDRKRRSVDDERVPENLPVPAEFALPVRLAQYDRLGLSVNRVVLGAEQPADVRPKRRDRGLDMAGRSP
jgi:hypothetical protein